MLALVYSYRIEELQPTILILKMTISAILTDTGTMAIKNAILCLFAGPSWPPHNPQPTVQGTTTKCATARCRLADLLPTQPKSQTLFAMVNIIDTWEVHNASPYLSKLNLWLYSCTSVTSRPACEHQRNYCALVIVAMWFYFLFLLCEFKENHKIKLVWFLHYVAHNKKW